MTFATAGSLDHRQRRLDVRHLARIGRVLRHARSRQGASLDRRARVPKLVHGDGRRHHKLPIKAEIRRAIGKEAGDTATVRLNERLS